MNKYEYPRPVLTVSIDALHIETKDIHSGTFEIKNTGGGELSGVVLSRCRGLSFDPAEFSGNAVQISYTFNASVAGLGIGESLDGKFFVTTNGGEREIPVTAKLTKMSIAMADGTVIANIRDFFEYSQTHPAQARRLFTDSEFYMLLLASGYEFMEVYESLHKDANRERAMDNFFILSGLKEKTTLTVVGDYGERGERFEFSQPPGNTEKLEGEFHIKKSDGGYVELPLAPRGAAPWLTLSSGKLTTADFDETNTATVTFTVDPAKIANTFAEEEIPIENAAIHIVYRRLPPVVLRLNRDSYRYSDHGAIEVKNNSGRPMQVSVFCPENYIRFSARSFPVDKEAEIPFEVKLSAFLNAQLLFRKLPFMETTIEVRAKSPGSEYKKILPITVGEW